MLYKQRSSFSQPWSIRRRWSFSSPCFQPRVTGGIDYRLMSGMRRLDTSAFDTSPPVCVQTKDICIKQKPSCSPDPLHNSWVLSRELLGVDRLVHLLDTGDSLLCSLSLVVMSGEVIRTNNIFGFKMFEGMLKHPLPELFNFLNLL